LERLHDAWAGFHNLYLSKYYLRPAQAAQISRLLKAWR